MNQTKQWCEKENTYLIKIVNGKEFKGLKNI